MDKLAVSVNDLKSLVTYIQKAQPVVSKMASLETEIQKRLPDVLNVLVSRGVLHSQLKEAKLKAIQKDPGELVPLMDKLATLAAEPVSALGGPSTVKSASSAPETADEMFARRILG